MSKKKKKRQIRFYRQHLVINDTRVSCVISCMLMVLDYYRRIERPTLKMETEMYGAYHSKISRKNPALYQDIPVKWKEGTPFSAAAYHLISSGLCVKLVHASENLFDNRENYYPENQIFDDMREEYCGWINRTEELSKTNGNFVLEKGTRIDSQRLREELDEGNLILLATIVDGYLDGILHCVLLYRYEGDCFYLYNPANEPSCGRVCLSEAELEHYISTPLGKWYLAVKDSKKEE